MLQLICFFQCLFKKRGFKANCSVAYTFAILHISYCKYLLLFHIYKIYIVWN